MGRIQRGRRKRTTSAARLSVAFTLLVFLLLVRLGEFRELFVVDLGFFPGFGDVEEPKAKGVGGGVVVVVVVVVGSRRRHDVC